MNLVGGLVLLFSLIAIPVAAVLSFFKAKRRAAKRLALLSVGGLVVGVALVLTADHQSATEAGFRSPVDQSAAAREGISSGEAWYALVAEREAEAARERARADAEAERQRLEQLAREEAEARAKLAAAEAEAAACRLDVSCWGTEHRINAESICKRQIERLARYDHEWTDSWLEPMFSRSAWQDKDRGVLIYFGDRLRLQNGFGAWANVIYACHYDPAADAVLDVSVEEGRL